MAVFPSFKLTKKGEELLNRSIGEGKKLTFTKFEIGDGNPPSDFREQTSLVNKFYQFPVLSTDIQKNQVLRIKGYFDNKSFTGDKQLKEIGVFVKIENDETEYLYSYTNAGESGDIIPGNTRGFYSRTLDVANYIGYATNITFNIEQLRDRYAFNSENEMKVASYLKAGDKVELWGNLVLGDKPTDEYIIQESGEIRLNNGLFAKKVSFKYIAQTIEEMKKLALKVGDVVEVLGYYTTGDGAGHKRKIEDVDDGSGVQLDNGKWANIVHNGEVNVSWFGAKGDGINDDTQAIQKAINYSKKNSNNICINFTSNCLIKNTIIVENSGVTSKGIEINGNGKRLIVGGNIDGIYVRGSNHYIHDMDIRPSSEFINNKKYTKIFITVQSINNFTSAANTFERILMYTSTIPDFENLETGTAIKIVADGNNFAYNQQFFRCVARNMNVCLDIDNKGTMGINGNYFDIISWNCDIYLKGNPQGSYFTGIVQTTPNKKDTQEKILNEYVIEDRGMLGNIFANIFYDTKYSKESKHQKIINIIGHTNNFLNINSNYSFDGDLYKNKINLYSTNHTDIQVPYKRTSQATFLKDVAYMPVTNSFRNLKNVSCSYENITNGTFYDSSYAVDSKGIPTNFAKLFSDNAEKRGGYLFCEENSKLILTITRSDFPFITIPITSFSSLFFTFGAMPKSSKLKIYKDEKITKEIQGIISDTFDGVVIFETGLTEFQKIEVEFIFSKINTIIKQASGVVVSQTNGII